MNKDLSKAMTKEKNLFKTGDGLNVIWFTFDACGLSIAKKLEDEGNTLVYAQIMKRKSLSIPNDTPEKLEDEKLRQEIGQGILEIYDADEILSKMKSIENKDDWFVVCDFNNMWKYGEAIIAMGFKNGFFPTKAQWEMEEDRNLGKEFVKKNYPGLKVAEVQEFKAVEEGIDFLEETDKVWVLKSYDPAGSTVVPMSDDPEIAKEEIIGAMELEKGAYEKAGFLLEEMIPNPIEVTPEAQWYNGELIMTTVDIENKPVGSGSVGNMTGCASNLIIKTDLKEKINDIAFPPAIWEMAKKHPGLFVFDASILINPKTKELYFGEFCANRWGWDSFFTNLAMCESVTSFFTSCLEGKNPLIHDFGSAVRMFNLKNHAEVPIILDDDKEVWLYNGKMKEDKLVSVGNCWELYVCTAGGKTIKEAVDLSYEELDKTSFTNGYYRPKFDFVSKDYKNSIMNRYDFTVEWLYGKRDTSLDTKDESKERKLKQMREDLDKLYGKN